MYIKLLLFFFVINKNKSSIYKTTSYKNITLTGEDQRIIDEVIFNESLIKKNLYKLDLLNKLQDDNINNINKIQLIDEYLIEDSDKYLININKCNLFKDWDFLF